MMKVLFALASLLAFVNAQNATFQFNGTFMSGTDSMNRTFGVTGTHNVRYDTGLYGPEVEEVHYCEWSDICWLVPNMHTDMKHRLWPMANRARHFEDRSNLYLLYTRRLCLHFGRSCQSNSRSSLSFSTIEYTTRRTQYHCQWHWLWLESVKLFYLCPGSLHHSRWHSLGIRYRETYHKLEYDADHAICCTRRTKAG